MSRGKARNLMDICADCCARDPTWASINRGVLICDECCSVHRSLGRHISQLKCLKKDTWSPTQLLMVHTLYANGANNIWEYSLLNPTSVRNGRRKPSHKDPVNPTKADFIRAKYQMLAFVHRQTREEANRSDNDVSMQLHSCVRTANVETCLRLLSLGADPNYYHPEKGTCCIHVACGAGQILQVELLCVYGADPGSFDNDCHSPSHYARQAGHDDLCLRLVELQYEVTDTFASYLCNRKPDHAFGQHFIVPEMAIDNHVDLAEFSRVAKRKLQSLSNNLFEELAMDVYDEVDRRHTDDMWQSCQSYNSSLTDRCILPFLPVNTEYSSTRNQGRQKLARFNAREFATLVIDIICEGRRRQLGLNVDGQAILMCNQVSNDSMKLKQSANSDEDPVYDSVASDDEQLNERHSLSNETASLQEESLKKEFAINMLNGHNTHTKPQQNLQQRPQSMYEPREQKRRFNTHRSQSSDAATGRSKDDAHVNVTSIRQSIECGNEDLPDKRTNIENLYVSRTTGSTIPSQQEGLSKTKNITQLIQELHFLARESKQERYIACAEEIFDAVLKLISIFPKDIADHEMKTVLRDVEDSASTLLNESKILLSQTETEKFDASHVAKQIILCAFETTKSIKTLITMLK